MFAIAYKLSINNTQKLVKIVIEQIQSCENL